MKRRRAGTDRDRVRSKKTTTACRACGLEGRTYYVAIMGKPFALCQGCTTDYLNVEAACEARAIQRERAANKRASVRAGVGPGPTDPALGECSECSGGGICANCNGTGESEMECVSCGQPLTNADVADVKRDPESDACRKCLASEQARA